MTIGSLLGLGPRRKPPIERVRWARCTARPGLPREAAQGMIARRHVVPLLTAPQVAELLRTVRRLIARGELAVVRIGRSVRIRAAALELLMLGG